MYLESLIFNLLTVFSAFLFLFRRFAKFNLYIYSTFYGLAVFLRPYGLDAIDNENFANAIQSQIDLAIQFW